MEGNHATNAWFYLNRVAGPHILVSSISDCRSKDPKFKSQLSGISSVEIDHEIISTFILHLPLIHSCQLLVNHKVLVNHLEEKACPGKV